MPRPSGTVSEQETATVAVKAIDAKAPSIRALTEDGRTARFKIEDKNNLKDVKAGVKVEIACTEPEMISVKGEPSALRDAMTATTTQVDQGRRTR